MKKDKYIKIRGARVHNLKNLSLDIPMNKLVVVTGVSGSGKSSLAFDTLFAEGQRRYVESLSSYARQFLGRITKPDVDSIEGIAPAIAVEQKVTGRNPRSTVGTTTEIYDYLKLLFARIGRLYSPVTGQEVRRYESTDVVRLLEDTPRKGRIAVAADVVLEPGQSLIEKITLIVGEGYDRMIYRDRICGLADVMADIDTLTAGDLAVVVDRIDLSQWNDDLMARLNDSVDIAMNMAEGRVIIADIDSDDKVTGRSVFSRTIDSDDGIEYIVPDEHLFSFNSPLGACPVCEGYGKTVGIDENLVIPNKNRSVYENAVACWNGDSMKRWKERVISTAESSGFPIHRPYNKLTDDQRKMLWRGCRWFKGIDAFFAMLEREKYKIQYRAILSRYTGKCTCPECGGGRLRKEAGYVRVDG
ncbi:MAG: excinuclease ABC subunit A, partial [Rikenellaceae bacterium]|nr:excinuclease ABC subunit A [Rikenellaceae bacterium]